MLALCLLFGREAGAEEPSIPVSLQAKLLSKLAGYDRNMRDRARDRVRVAILVKPDNPDSVRVGREMQHALGEIAEFAGMPHEEISLTYAGPAALSQACSSRGLSIVYVTPGFDGDSALIAHALSGVDVLTVSAVAGYVPKGIVVGFDAVGGQTLLLIHLPQARAQHVAFGADVLKLMKVYK